MTIDPNHTDHARARALLDRQMSRELDDEESRWLEEHLSACSSCRAELADRERVGAALRGAVGRRSGASDALRARIGRDVDSNVRTSQVNRWLYAAAAMIVLVLASVFLVRTIVTSGSSTVAHGDSTGNPSMDRAVRLLRVGLGDHTFCAVGYHGDDVFTAEQMVEEMGEKYAGLLPIVREQSAGFKLNVGHQCTFEGRRFVHMILRRDTAMISISITSKEIGEHFPKERLIIALESSGIPLYQHPIDDYQVAGFETKEYVVYVVSNLRAEENLQLASSLAPRVHDYLSNTSVEI